MEIGEPWGQPEVSKTRNNKEGPKRTMKKRTKRVENKAQGFQGRPRAMAPGKVRTVYNKQNDQ